MIDLRGSLTVASEEDFTLSITLDGDTPGHDFRGNQWSGGSGRMMPSGEKVSRGEQYKIDKKANLERVTNLAKEEAERQGLAPSNLKVITSDKKFMLNGEEHNYAGSFAKDTGKVTIYATALMTSNDQQVKSVIAHEVGHKIFEPAYDAGCVFTDWQGQPSSTKGPAAKYLGNDKSLADLAREDGVTSYSRDWWKAHEQHASSDDRTWLSEFKQSQRSALHETFAELHKLASFNPAKFKEVTDTRPTWKALYTSVMSKARLGRKI